MFETGDMASGWDVEEKQVDFVEGVIRLRQGAAAILVEEPGEVHAVLGLVGRHAESCTERGFEGP
jgi:hypothetical protein